MTIIQFGTVKRPTFHELIVLVGRNFIIFWHIIWHLAKETIPTYVRYPILLTPCHCTVEYSIALLWGQDNVKRLKIVHVQFLNCVIYGVVHAILGNRDTHPLSSLLAQKLSCQSGWCHFHLWPLLCPALASPARTVSVAPTVFTHNPNRRHATTCKVSTTTCKPELVF